VFGLMMDSLNVLAPPWWFDWIDSRQSILFFERKGRDQVMSAIGTMDRR